MFRQFDAIFEGADQAVSTTPRTASGRFAYPLLFAMHFAEASLWTFRFTGVKFRHEREDTRTAEHLRATAGGQARRGGGLRAVPARSSGG
jgi:hypothetical protein